MSIKVKCKRCNNSVDSDELTLDYVYKMMVCKNCVKERIKDQKDKQDLKKQAETRKEAKKDLPRDWDHEDEYLERYHTQKKKKGIPIEWVNDNKIRFNCPGCNIAVNYSILKQAPRLCPHCGKNISVKKIVKPRKI